MFRWMIWEKHFKNLNPITAWIFYCRVRQTEKKYHRGYGLIIVHEWQLNEIMDFLWTRIDYKMFRLRRNLESQLNRFLSTSVERRVKFSEGYAGKWCLFPSNGKHKHFSLSFDKYLAKINNLTPSYMVISANSNPYYVSIRSSANDPRE